MPIGKFSVPEWRKLKTWMNDSKFDHQGYFGNFDTGNYISVQSDPNSGDHPYIFPWNNGSNNYQTLWIDAIPLRLNPFSGGAVQLYGSSFIPIVNTGVGSSKMGITAGKLTVPNTGGSIVFNVPFSSAPIVTATAINGSAIIAAITAVSVNSFTIKAFNTANGAVSSDVNWQALGAFS